MLPTDELAQGPDTEFTYWLTSMLSPGIDELGFRLIYAVPQCSRGVDTSVNPSLFGLPMRILLFFVVYLCVASGYLLYAWDHWGTLPTGISAFMREQVDTDHENSLIELFSATAWMIATVLFARRFVITWKAGGNEWVCRWILCFALLSLVAFGEEISWGTHWTGPDRFSDYVNSQWSIHNQSIGSLKLVHYTNLAFYAGMLFLWVALPVMKDRPPLRRWTAFVSMPIPSRMTRQFFVVNTITYLVLDRIFNVGHVYEASTGVVAILVAITMRDDDGRDAHPT